MRRPALLAALGPAVVLGAFALAWTQGAPAAVRHAWIPLAPAAFAFLGALAPVLLARGVLARPTARAWVMASLAGLAALGTLVVLVPLEAWEAPESRLFPAIDVALSGALVALAALGVARAWTLATWLVAALLLARAGAVGASALAVGVEVGSTLLGAFLWAGAALLASALAAARFRLSARSPTRG